VLGKTYDSIRKVSMTGEGREKTGSVLAAAMTDAFGMKRARSKQIKGNLTGESTEEK